MYFFRALRNAYPTDTTITQPTRSYVERSRHESALSCLQLKEVLQISAPAVPSSVGSVSKVKILGRRLKSIMMPAIASVDVVSLTQCVPQLSLIWFSKSGLMLKQCRESAPCPRPRLSSTTRHLILSARRQIAQACAKLSPTLTQPEQSFLLFLIVKPLYPFFGTLRTG